MKKIISFTSLYAAGIACLIYLNPKQPEQGNFASTAESELSAKDNAYHENREQEEKEAEANYDGPAEFIKFHRSIRMAEGELKPGYVPGYKYKEAQKAEQRAYRISATARTKAANGVLEWKERGPVNVPGRTRGLLVDPDDASKNTWYAGTASGGVWKTTNGGNSWTNITPNLPNLATTVLAMAESNHNVIYIGTGEGFGNLDAVNGGGIFKSIDRGATWNLLSSTASFPDINRIAIDRSNPDVVVAATNGGIYKTTNGGSSWTEVLNENSIQDLRATPGNFNVLYAAQYGVGVWKSTDAGTTWNKSNTGMGPVSRVEIAVSPVNTNKIFASADNGDNPQLLVSSDAAQTWQFVDVRINSTVVNFLGEKNPGNGQGWYDNTIMCDPFNQNVVYYGGIDLFQTEVSSTTSSVVITQLDAGTTTNFLYLTPSATASNVNFDVGTAANGLSVEIRFGPGQTQKAHRFMVPTGATSGVPDANYSYQDYVNVPFTVWDVTTVPNRQLMASFRDQGRDGEFSLIPSDLTSAASSQSREYLFVNNVTYNPTTPSSGITTNGGHEFNKMYDFWPTRVDGATWPPASNSTLKITATPTLKYTSSSTNITDARGSFSNNKNRNVHPDQHNLVAIPVSPTTFKILVANDGGIYVSNISNTPGIDDNTWTAAGNSLNSTQFYGADKRPGSDQFFGGAQDNGTWVSANGIVADATTPYASKIGGDGFEVLWNNLNPQLLIGGYQGNGFNRSIDGGINFIDATSGLSGNGNMPFISKLANSRSLPDRIFTLGEKGVFVSQNFGETWQLTPISTNWVPSDTPAPSFMDIEVSRANANIVWAGAGMTSSLKLHVSTNGGQSFTPVNNSSLISAGITKLASHPTEANTAYALFSAAKKPKILKTTDLGNSWTEMSGFGGGTVSTNGFPDVAVYCLYVRPDNTSIIWAGTEIGIVESLDGGSSWAILNDFPKVAVWDLKGVDDQIVIATHGRGIWTAKINALQTNTPKLPIIAATGTNPSEKFSILITSDVAYDSMQIFVDKTKIGSLKNVIAGETVVDITGLSFGVRTVSGIAFKGSSPYSTTPVKGQYVDLAPNKSVHADYFTDGLALSLSNFSIGRFDEQSAPTRTTLHTPHPYLPNVIHTALITVPITISNANATFKFRDVAIVEPVNDPVIVEGTLDGVHWLPLEPAYDASKNTDWLSTYNAGGKGKYAQMVSHNINLLSTFKANDKVLFRFRMVSATDAKQSWGWAIDYIAIQEEPTEVEVLTPSDASATVFPNPASEEATLRYTVAKPGEVRIDVISNDGKQIRTINKGTLTTGVYSEKMNCGDFPTGTYIIKIRKADRTESVRFAKK